MLDLSKIAAQVDSVINRLRIGANEHNAHLSKALSLINLNEADFEHLKQKAAQSRTTWLVAGLVEPPAGHFLPPPLPPSFSILATDGSQIDVDRHQSTRCFLINIGRVRLDYGAKPGAVLNSLPTLYADEADLFMTDGMHEQAVEGNLLGIKRGVEELTHLADLAGEIPTKKPALALVDGSLIMWGLTGEKYPDFVVEQLLEKGYLRALDRLRQLSEQSELTIASYISFPRSTDVANALRLVLCPEAIADCDRCCKSVANSQRPCALLSGVQDRDIFSEILKEGERSSLFFTQSKIVKDHYGPHRVYFFYLKLEAEIARVEVPEWVARNGAKIGLTHSMLLDQCRRGQGYPTALAEAHEQAVVTGADRESFQDLLDAWFVREHIPQTSSAKNWSKRTKWI